MSKPEQTASPLSANRKTDASTARASWLWAIAAGLALAVILSGYIRCLAKYGDLTPMIRFGTEFQSSVVPTIRAEPHAIQEGNGFDGQFYAQLATDPLLLKPETPAAMDNVSVRPRRILIPAVTWLFSFGGEANAVLWIYPLINFVAWLVLVVVAWRILPRDGRGLAIGCFLAIVLGPGVIESASRALSDLPAFLFAFAALGVAGCRGSWLLGLAALGRETTLLAWPGRIGNLRAWRTDWRGWLTDGAIAAAPLALWMAILHLRFGSGGAGVDGGNLGLPLSGLFARLKEIVQHLSAQPIASVSGLLLHPAIQCGLLIIAVVTQLVFLLAKPKFDDGLWRWGLLAGILGLCLGWATWEAFYTVTRHLLPLHLAFNLLLAKSETRLAWLWLVVGNLHVLPRVLYWMDFH